MSDPKGGDVIQMPCLGRPFTMGMLYDCRKDALVPGLTLWNNATLKKALDSKDQVAEGCEIIAEDTLESKATNLDISANLKLSFLGGLIKVQGSAKYLDDRTSSMEVSRVSLKYWSTSKFDQLTMEQLGNIEFPEVFRQKIATHVVVGVLYGADAFFVFDRKVEKSENKKEVNGSMQAMLKKAMGSIDIQGGAELKIGTEDRKEVKAFQCKFHGDLHLKSNPTTFDSAIKIYQDLPNLLREGGSPNVVPKKVWLYPLIKLDSTAARVVNEISVSLVKQAQDVMEEILRLENQTNDLFNTSVSSYFLGMQEQLSSFKERLREYKLYFSRKLNHLLPNIREGGEKESALAELLEQKQASPFASDMLSKWMTIKHQEIKVLEGYFQAMKKVKSIQFALSPGDLDALVTDFTIERVLCFSLKVITSTDPFIQQMLAFLRMTKSSSSKDITISSWIRNKKIMTTLRQRVQQFTEFAAVNEGTGTKFVITDDSTSDVNSGDGAEILLYENGLPEPFSPPLNPRNLIASKDGIKHDSVKLEWVEPQLGSESVLHYTISYQEKGRNVSSTSNWKMMKTKSGKELTYTVDNLQSLTAYQFKVRAECYAGVSKQSDTITISTLSPPTDRLALKMKNASTKVEKKNESTKVEKKDESTNVEAQDESKHLPVYKLPQKVTHNVPGQMIRTVEVGRKPEEDKAIEHKVLMVVGATGAGKSTLINGMVNYILKVKWKDDFRFKLIVDEVATQTKSVTSEITAYTLHHMEGSNLCYSITIIDTPGFGDTAGIKRDKQITEQIKNFFSLTEQYGIDHLNGIGFVTQSALVRLTATQQYIFDSILAVFGNDVAKNIFIMVTFCDGKEPPVVKAVDEAKIPYSKYFKFNNSALEADNSSADDDNFDEMFWKMGMSSFKKFFGAFQQAKSVSLTLTQQVLDNRAKLETAIQGLQRQMNACLAEMEVLHQEEIAIRKHEADLEANKDFEVEINVPYYETIKLNDNEYVTNCLQCNFTCHFPCGIPDSGEKWKCAAMDSTWIQILQGGGQSACCTVCSGKCHWKVHKNTRERFELRYKMEKKTSKELKEKYDAAGEKKSTVERMIKSHANQLGTEHAKLHELIEEARQCLEILNSIALKPNPLTQVDYIQLLIESEERQAKEGWSDRVSYLEETKDQAVLLTIVKDDDDIDQRIEAARQEQGPGWEQKIEKLEEIKRIKHTVDKHEVERSYRKGFLTKISESVSAGMAAAKKKWEQLTGT